MPPSLDHDSSNTPNGNSQPSKLTQKGFAAGGSASTRNGKKNGTAKDSGGSGVLAAVTKNASKNNKSAKTIMSPMQSPGIEPVGSPPEWKPCKLPFAGRLVFSRDRPVIVAEYQRMGQECSGVFQLSKLASFGWTTREQRTTPSGHVASASPPNRRRPLSYQMDGNYTQSFDDHRSQVSSYAARRSSMYSQHPRYAQHPPLPHQAQAHFYGAPDANLLLSPPGPGLVPGEGGYYCGFDSISSSDPTKPDDKVVLTGFEGGVSVYAVTKRGLKKTLSLEGLRGGVYSAKILPWSVSSGSSQGHPLIAVVVHGPALTSGGSSSGEETGNSSDGPSLTPNGSVRGSPRIPRRVAPVNETIEYYQTAVEVYSLSTKQHVATLISLPKTRLSMPSTNPLFSPPPPVGSLTIRADFGNVVIASGTTGETWIFHQKDVGNSTLGEFRCIGKVWTAVQHGVSVDPTAVTGNVDSDWNSSEHLERKPYKASILSLSGRWLAYCPSAPSSQVSLRADIPGIAPNTRVPGLNGHAPPQLPSINCSVETPGGESMVKQIMQAGTQALIGGGTYLGKQIGRQGASLLNHYFNRSPPNQPTNSAMTYHNPPTTTQFPPTHGVPTQAPAIKDPGLVSILDLESLAHHGSFSAPPHPLATFKIPYGCSFLSFAPSGLALFTASSKGDVQCVWDLMRIQFAKSSFLKGGFQGSESKGPHVRQIAQFSRMTIARIVDVVWTSPHGERAAMVTEPGTVHILDLPASAFTWPPPRRRIASPQRDESGSESAVSGFTASGVATTAVNSLWTAAKPLVSRRRRSSVGISAKAVTAQAGHGTQALAAGISRSVGAATGRMNEMRKSGSTKLHLPRSSMIPSKSCVLLLNRKRSDSVIVVGGGIVRVYTIKNRRADRPADKQKASRGAKYVEFRLPSLPEPKPVHELIRDLNLPGDLEFNEADIDVQWKSNKSPIPTARQRGTESSIPQAEIESNAPYQPFHTDRRVGLHIYLHPEASLPSPSVSALFSPPPRMRSESGVTAGPEPNKTAWAFGGAIRSSKLEVGPIHIADDDLDSSIDHRPLPTSAIERILMVKDNNEDMEQIVVTTRRRKGASRSGTEAGVADEEGFFEDDCEVLDFASQRV
ncbi:hypothetical protein G7Y89_g7054 [Cudoniella acicularis]|uniref:Uncharacterized protein n=1 Tax=Cudoniella acicularis TaxID=354080 RepID=A0A8H4RL49_9HELO|nr:hypothetical protein G7Y89_g7054 [Cudoniella acicularis]